MGRASQASQEVSRAAKSAAWRVKRASGGYGQKKSWKKTPSNSWKQKRGGWKKAGGEKKQGGWKKAGRNGGRKPPTASWKRGGARGSVRGRWSANRCGGRGRWSANRYGGRGRFAGRARGRVSRGPRGRVSRGRGGYGRPAQRAGGRGGAGYGQVRRRVPAAGYGQR